MRWTLLIGLCAACAPHTPTPQAPAPPFQSSTERTGFVHPSPAPVPVAVPRAVAGREPAPAVPPPAPPQPSPEDLEQALLEQPQALGSASIGAPNNGGLFNGVQLVEDQYLRPVDPHNAWGTRETVDYLRAAAQKVHERYPGSPKLQVGHISSRDGGHLSPHRSHQSGRDVDISFYYKDETRWYRRATSANLDLERTWWFVRALITETDVEMILIDRSLSVLLRRHAAALGEDPNWLANIFGNTRGQQALIRHERGHRTHMHVRFFNPQAQRLGRRVYPLLRKHDLFDKIEVYRYHWVQKGDTLGKLAKRYGTTVRAIKRANGLRSTVIQAKKRYKIPDQDVPSADSAIVIPPRRLPPESPKAAAESPAPPRPVQ